MSLFGLTNEWFNLKDSVCLFVYQIHQVNSFQFFNLIWSRGENPLCRLRICKCYGKAVGFFSENFPSGFFVVFQAVTYLQTQKNEFCRSLYQRYYYCFRGFHLCDTLFSIDDLFVLKFF